MIMDEIANFKKTQINNYFHSLYDLNEDNLNIQQIKMDLQQLIDEIPGIDLHYETEKLIAEDGGDEVKIEKLSGITIFYSYDVNMGFDENGKPIIIPRFEKMSYMI